MRATSCVVLSLLCGCPDRTVSAVVPEQGKVETKDTPAAPRKDIDILFVIDNSRSMVEEQDSLKANFPRFISVLESLDGGLPNVQIGVVTPNLGTTAIDGTSAPSLDMACTQTGGDKGELETLGAGGPRFIRDVARAGGGRDTNYGAQTLSQAFAQLASVGAGGCGIEQHLEAMKRSLENPVNTGFVRDNAYLAVIVIADEDDCSIAKASFFDGPRDVLYPDAVNFRCTTRGVECDTPPDPLETTLGRRINCHSKDEPDVVAPIDRYVEFLKKKKADPRDVIVAGIVGDPDPFEIVNKQVMTPSGPVTVKVLGRSCTYNGPTGEQLAFPAVRTSEFLAQFPNNARTTICDSDLSDGLEQIGVLLRKTIVDSCFDYKLAEPYDCSVTEVRRHPNAPDEELRTVAACGNGALPCWRIEEAPTECAYTKVTPHLKLVIERGSAVPDPDIRVKASCVTAQGTGPLQ